jgi:AmmeMemoRadiSam system protein A
MSPLLNAERRILLALARRAIIEAVVNNRLLEVPPPVGALARPSGAFVSLHRHGRLRGCIGQIEPADSLAVTVARCAVSAAVEDPRFYPVTPEELGELEIEISILSPLQLIQPEQIEVGKHGLLVTRGRMRGLLLPQVATQYRWTRERFLEETCYKAGLERDDWKDPAARVEAFTAEVFSEADLRSEQRAQAS